MLLLNVFLFRFACSPPGTDTGDGTSEGAPDVLWYAATGEGCCGEDPHPVHGAETSDGGFVLVGKSADSDGSINGFMMKIGPDIPSGFTFLDDGEANTVTWGKEFGEPGTMEMANNVASIGDSVFVVGGKSISNGTVQRLLKKVNSNTGEEIWSTVFSSSSNTESAFESIFITPNGDAVLAGFVNGEQGGIEGFKSYGNPVSGVANVMVLSSEQLQASSAPENPIWEKDYSNHGSIRGIRTNSDGYVFVAPKNEELYSVVYIDENGEELWQRDLSDHGEATDITVVMDADTAIGYAVSGHRGVDGGIDGSVTMLDLDGSVLWTKHYGNPSGGIQEFAGLDGGNPELIFDECWGLQSTNNASVVVACGTGIEGCEGLGLECRNDPRTKWRGLLMEIDSSGEQLWYRTDSYYFDGEDEAAASASEYIIRTQDGNYASVVDQDFGIGLMVVKPQ